MDLRERLARRRGSGPEHNLIQKPSLLRAIQQALGLQQSHVVPVVADTLQAVIVVDDITRAPSGRPYSFSCMKQFAGDGVFPFVVNFENPANSNLVCSLREVHFDFVAPTETMAPGSSLWWNMNNAGGVLSITRGIRTMSGRGQPGGADAVSGRLSSAAGITATSGAVAIGYAEQHQSTVANPLKTVTYRWGGEGYIRVLVYPGGAVTWQPLADVNVGGTVTMKWDEWEL